MCNIITDPIGCSGEVVGGVLGGAAEGVATSAADAFFQMIADGARDLLETVSTFWMKVPSPEVAQGSGQSWTGSSTVTSIQSWISPIALLVFTVTVGITLVKIAADTRRAHEGFTGIVRALVATLAGGLPVLAVTMVGIKFGDEFSPWILEQASGEKTSDGFGEIFTKAMFGTAAVPGASGALLIIYLLAIFGAIMQCLFMVIRGATIYVLVSFSQVTAAGTATEEGWLRFKRVVALLIGFVLYKPVAAVVYGVGLRLMSDGTTKSDQIMNSLYGLTVLVMAALALPALIKFVAPAAAVGSSGAFSGAAGVGMVATGASVVALAGAGGAGLSGAGGAGALRGAGGGTGAGASQLATTPSNAGGASGSGSSGSAGSGGSGSSGETGGGDGGGGEGTGARGATGAPGSSTQTPAAGGGGAGSADPGGGRHRAGGAQLGAQTVQSVTSSINRAGEDAGRES